MRKIILFTAVIFLFFSSAFSQYKWSDLTYHFQTGSLPPPYYYEYDILISAFGDLTLLYSPDYNFPKPEQWKYDLKLTDEHVRMLDAEITSGKVLDETFEFDPPGKVPIGSSLENLKITLYQDPALDQIPTVIETPYFPKNPEQKKLLVSLYKLIRTMVPDNIWDEMQKKKDEFQKKNIK